MIRGPRPAAVTTVAVIGIIFASFGTIATLMGFPKLTRSANFETFEDIYGVADWSLSTGLTILLFIGAIGSLSLRPVARKLMIIFAWGDIAVWAGFGVYMYAYVIPKVDSAMVAATMSATLSGAIPPGSPSPVAAMGMASTMLGVAVGALLVLVMVYPILVLAFYTRPKVVNAFNGIFDNILPGMSGGFPIAAAPPPPNYPPGPPQ